MILPNDSLILKTKLTLPLLKKNMIRRDRLLQQLESGSLRRITVISAPAGFGKTTLLAQWIHETVCLSAWVSLDERDNDYIRFWRSIVYAFASAVSEKQGTRLLQIARSIASFSLTTFLDTLVNELYELPPVTLVLDDLHCVTDSGILDGLFYFLEIIPESVHVILSTRTGLPFPSIKWKARDEQIEIGMSQLQFSDEEARQYFAQAAVGYPNLGGLTEQHINRLAAQTEGWVTGMQLLSLSLRSEPDFNRLITEFKGNRDIAEYLFYEVVSGLPGDLYDFLLKTSIFTRMDAAACTAVTQDASSLEMIQDLLRLNLFLIPLGESNEWFRYHQLFANFLQDQLRKTKGQAEWAQLNEKAAVHFAEVHFMDEAIEHALAARSFLLAETFLNRHAAVMLKRGELVTLLRWLNSFPEGHCFKSDTTLLYAFVCVLTEQFVLAETKLEQVEQECAKEQNDQTRLELQSGLLFVRSNLVFMTGDFGKWFAFSEGILDHLVPDNSLYFNFDYNHQKPLVRQTPMGLKGVLTTDTEKIGLLFGGVLEKHGWGESLIALYVKQALCEGYYEWNRLEECRKLLGEIARTDACRNTPGLAIPNRLMEAKLYMTEQRYSLAQHVLEEAEEAASMYFGSDWLPFIAAFRSRISLAENKLPQAKKEIAKLGVSAKDRPSNSREFQYLALVRLLAKQRKEADGLRILELLKPQAEKEQQLSSVVEIGVLQALLEFKRGHKLTALRFLHETLLAAEPNNYIRTVLDEGPELVPLLKQYADALQNPDTAAAASGLNLRSGTVSAAYVEQLIRLFPASAEEAPALSAIEPELAEPLNRSEIELLRLLRQGATNKAIAKALSLSEGTVRVYLSRLYNKLQVSSRTQALIVTQELELLTD